MISEEELLENYNTVLANIEKAVALSGREMSDITIVAASKTMPIERIRFVLDNTKIRIVGENRVQELTDKYTPDIEWHFIGQLQSNKVKYIIDKVSLIHSLDRLSLAAEIDRQAKKHNIVANVLIEINMACEDSKGGISPDCMFEFLEQLIPFENICIKGIMAVMPNVEGQELENYYLQLSNLYAKLLKTKAKNADIRYLSAGMSNDYQTALKYGANLIRLGRAIFGER